MKTRISNIKFSPELLFFMFALLIGIRDIGAEVIFSEHPREARTCFAFLVCATITILSLILIIADKGLPELLRKISASRILAYVILVGTSAAVVYLVTFEMIGLIGAGLFDLFDYGLAPILTGMLGIIFFGNSKTKRFWIAVVFYIVGILLLFWGNQTTGWAWVVIAILSPIGTAVSDATTKWLLSEEGGNLTRSELLFVRFLPATVLIGIWIFATGGQIHLHEAVLSIPLAVFCGFAPLWFLCTGLGRAALTKFAVWEFLIPAIAFFTTLPRHPDHVKFSSISGALIIILAVLLYEINWFTKIKNYKFSKISSKGISKLRRLKNINKPKVS